MKTLQELHYELAQAYLIKNPGLRDQGAIELAQQNMGIWLKAFPGLFDLNLKTATEGVGDNRGKKDGKEKRYKKGEVSP